MKALTRLALIALAVSSCSDVVRDTPTNTVETGVTGSNPVAETTEPECLLVTGGADPVATGTVAGDALHLSGESFICSNDVVVTNESDLNELAVAAQLAAALGGPILLPHPQLAAELGRLKPQRIHVVGSIEVSAPPGADTNPLTIADAVELAKETLGVNDEVPLPAVPDASTVVETVLAIRDRDRVVVPETLPENPGTIAGEPAIPAGEVVSGLAIPSSGESVWLTDSANPEGILMASATAGSVGAVVVAYDPNDVFAHPEVSTALAGLYPGSIRYVGLSPDTDEWELATLIRGDQVPGGGFTVFPADQPRRFVAMYGHPETSALGALGEQGPEATLDRLQPFLDAYTGDGSQVIPTFEMIASVASASATDGDYSEEWPVEAYADWIDVAEANDVYVILDLQPGRDDFLNQAKQYEELLKLPFVGLALDPEWRLEPDQVHLRQVGHVDAAEVNLVVDWLADLVREHALPQKIIIVHQFRETMIENRETLKQRPELQMIVQMDGDGTHPQKDETYAVLTTGTENAHWRWGWKNFFDEDEPGPPSPESTMGKVPTPVYVSYQ